MPFIVKPPADLQAWHSKSKEDIRELEQGLKDLTKVFSQLPEAEFSLLHL